MTAATYNRVVYFLRRHGSLYWWDSTADPNDAIGPFYSRKEARQWMTARKATVN